MKRFKRRCPDCHGEGRWTDVILDEGTGPYVTCDYCNGTGYITNKRLYYTALGYISAAKRAVKNKGRKK